MSAPPAGATRRIVEAVRDLPDGLVATGAAPEDVAEATELLRAVDLAGCGHSTSNADETRAALAEPDCGWGQGAAAVRRGSDLIGLLLTSDGLTNGRGWWLDVFVQPGDPDAAALSTALIAAGLREGRERWAAIGAAAGPTPPQAKSGAYANDALLRAQLEAAGFAEVRRFWRMRIDRGPAIRSAAHSAPEAPTASDAPASSRPDIPPEYVLRDFTDSDAELRALHRASNDAFADHFDFAAVPFDDWLGHVSTPTNDRSQWLVVEHESAIVGFARGSNRYASEGFGYVESLGVLRAHRGRGLARALLLGRFADDASRGHTGTLLHVDSDSPTGATRLYASVGMVADSELVWFFGPRLG